MSIIAGMQGFYRISRQRPQIDRTYLKTLIARLQFVDIGDCPHHPYNVINGRSGRGDERQAIRGESLRFIGREQV